MSDKSIFITGAIILTTLFSVGLYMVKGLYRDMKAMNNMEEKNDEYAEYNKSIKNLK